MDFLLLFKLNLTSFAASECWKKHLMWSMSSKRERKNSRQMIHHISHFASTLDSSDWEKHIHRYAESWKQKIFCLSERLCRRKMNFTWALERRNFISRSIIFRSACGQKTLVVHFVAFLSISMHEYILQPPRLYRHSRSCLLYWRWFRHASPFIIFLSASHFMPVIGAKMILQVIESILNNSFLHSMTSKSSPF